MIAALAGSPLAQALAWTLLHFLWQGAAIAGALALALRLLGRAGAPARYAAACAALLLMALAPPVTLALLWAPASAPPPGVPFLLLPLGDAPAALPAPAPTAGAQALALLLLAWMAGALFMSARLALGIAALRAVVRRHATPLPPAWQARLDRIAHDLGLRRRVRLLGSDHIDAPLTLGWLRPVILVPLSALTALPAPCLEAILAHELAHVRRWDYLVNVLQTAVEAALFYHPCVHWVSRCIRAEREHCCDDVAAAHVGDPIRYARALLRLEELRAEVPAIAVAATGGSLMNRVKRLVQKHPAVPSRAAWLTPALLTAGALALALGAASACGQASADPAVEAEAELAAAPAALGIRWLPPALERWAPAIEAAAARHRVDPDALAIMTLVESCGNPAARSPSGALGLMQIMPRTAARIAEERSLPAPTEDTLRDPETNLDLGAYYLGKQLTEFGVEADPLRSVELAAAAYNGGEARVRAYLQAGKPLSEETEQYKALVAGMWSERREPRSATFEAWQARSPCRWRDVD